MIDLKILDKLLQLSLNNETPESLKIWLTKRRTMYKLKNLEELGKKIRNERRKLDLSQSDVSLQTGLSISYISLLESGKYLPSWKKNDWREKLCIILNLEENDFFLTIDEIREEKKAHKERDNGFPNKMD